MAADQDVWFDSDRITMMILANAGASEIHGIGSSLSEGNMTRDVYYVALHEGEWEIIYDRDDYGPYKTQQMAIRASVDAAHHAGAKNSECAQILVQGENSQFRTE